MGELVSERQEMIDKQLESARTTSTLTTTMTTVSHRSAVPMGVSLWCFVLMMPFGYEPKLLAAQEQQRVGIFECDEHVVFTNSSTLLGPDPLPMNTMFSTRVQLLDFSLSVPYGGEWHTALNTPVFNRIWGKVREMGDYRKYDWVVKADPDTVWFPSRLKDVLVEALPRKLLSEPPDPEGNSCKYCKMPGHTQDTCEQHVKWLQAKRNFTCKEALASVAKDNDCGCHCS